MEDGCGLVKPTLDDTSHIWRLSRDTSIGISGKSGWRSSSPPRLCSLGRGQFFPGSIFTLKSGKALGRAALKHKIFRQEQTKRNNF